jgi:hypothetical protein
MACGFFTARRLSTVKTFHRYRSGGQFRPLDAGGAAPQHAMAKIRRIGALCRDLGAGCRPSSAEAVTQLYRLRLITADPLSLRNRTVCDLPCKTTLITPEIPYSLL